MHEGWAPKLQWRVARVVDSTPETESARTIGLSAPGWSGHLAGQHIDLKLTAEDGYSAQRSYSLARPADGERIELTVQQIPTERSRPISPKCVLARRSSFADPSAAGSFGARRSRPGFCWLLADRASCH